MIKPAMNHRRDASHDPSRPVGAALAVILAVIVPRAGAACTAFVIKNGGVVLLAKNLDWPVGDGYVFVNKRHVVKEAFGGASSPPLRWTSEYGSVTFNQFGREFPLGGINEQGLVIEELSGPAGYPSPDKRPALNELQWIQYQLDNHRSVKDVLKSEARLRISKLLFNLHFLVADRSGKTAVVEYAGGKMLSYTGNDLPVRVLSDNSYAESLRNLRMYKGFGGERGISEGSESAERFVRAAAVLEDFEWPIQGVLSDHAFTALRSVEQTDTQWSIVYNISRRLVFFKTKSHRRLKVIRLEALDFSCGSPVLMLPVDTEAGWILTENFAPYDPQKNRRLLETVFRKLEGLGEPSEIPAAGLVGKMSEYPATCRCR
jgi:choloylglycine hydrolase